MSVLSSLCPSVMQVKLSGVSDKYQSLLRSAYSSVVEYIQQSWMKFVNTWATEVEIQVTADCLGVSVCTFVYGRWLKYSCSSKCLSEASIYLENIGGEHFEFVVCVCKPGLQSCYGYCKVGEETGYSTRARTIGVVNSDVAAVRSEKGDCGEVVEDAGEHRKSVRSKYLRQKMRLREKFSMSLREKRQLRIRKLYIESMIFREKAKLSSVDRYSKNISHRLKVKAISILKYRENLSTGRQLKQEVKLQVK